MVGLTGTGADTSVHTRHAGQAQRSLARFQAARAWKAVPDAPLPAPAVRSRKIALSTRSLCGGGRSSPRRRRHFDVHSRPGDPLLSDRGRAVRHAVALGRAGARLDRAAASSRAKGDPQAIFPASGGPPLAATSAVSAWVEAERCSRPRARRADRGALRVSVSAGTIRRHRYRGRRRWSRTRARGRRPPPP